MGFGVNEVLGHGARIFRVKGGGGYILSGLDVASLAKQPFFAAAGMVGNGTPGAGAPQIW